MEFLFFFFFQAEDGIRDIGVTGVQTCALPISHELLIEDARYRTIHGGVGLTMASVRENYWVPRLRRATKKIVRSCYGCRRYLAKPIDAPPVGICQKIALKGLEPFRLWG